MWLCYVEIIISYDLYLWQQHGGVAQGEAAGEGRGVDEEGGGHLHWSLSLHTSCGGGDPGDLSPQQLYYLHSLQIYTDSRAELL